MSEDFYSLFTRGTTPRELASVTPLDPERATRYAAKALTSECENVAAAPEGERNHTLNRAAFSIGQLVAGGYLERDAANDALYGAARAAGLGTAEIEATLASGFRGGAQQPRVVAERPDVPDATVLPELDAETERGFWSARPILTHIHDFARARRVAPWAVLGVTLARVVTLTPWTVCLPPIVGGRASLNLFVGLVGTSGAGKGGAEAVAADVLSTDYVDIHKTGSGEGIAHGYMMRSKGDVEWRTDTHAVMFSVPEIDAMAAQADRRGATLMPELRSAWSGERLGFGYADPSRRLPVPAHEYRLTLVAGIQPLRAACLLDDSDGGTPQRFIWLPVSDRDAPDRAPLEPPPMTWSPPKLHEIQSVGGNQMKVTETARAVIDAARLARLRGQGEALDGHALLCRLKTSAALAILDGRYSVTDEDWRLGGIIQDKSDATRAGVVEALRSSSHERNYARGEAEAARVIQISEKVADQGVERVCRVVTRKLRRTGDWTTRGELSRAVTSTDRDYLDVSLERLIEAGQIATSEAEYRGQSGLKYRLREDS